MPPGQAQGDPLYADLDERAEAHAAVADFGRFAMACRDPAATVERAVQVVCETLNAPVGALIRLLAQPGRLCAVSTRGADDWLPSGIELELPAPSGRPRSYDPSQPMSIPDWQFSEPHLLPPGGLAAGVRSSVSSPVLIGGRLWGRLAVMDTRPRRWTGTEVDVLQSVSHLLAASLDRSRGEITHAAIAGFGRFALGSRDIGATMNRSVALVADVLEVPLGRLFRLDPGYRRLIVAASDGSPELPVGAVVSVDGDIRPSVDTDRPLEVEDWRNRPSRLPAALAQAGVISSLGVSVMVGNRTWGRLSAMDVRPRRFSELEADFLQSLAHLLASAMERDLIETRLRQTTRQLQRALLPGGLPSLSGIETAARYLPAGDDVGGDWYDVLRLPDGAVGLVMGDVEGHDNAAAAVMGQVRNVLRAHAAEGHHPAEILARVNRFVIEHTDRMVTCCYAELRPDEHIVTLASAGHPAPLVLHPDGRTEPLPTTNGPPLGTDPDRRYTEQTTVLPSGGCLLLVTDGLVDNARGVVHLGMAALGAAAADVVGEPIEALADALVSRPAGAEGLRDDAALLAVRLTSRPATDGVRRSFGPYPAAVPAARTFVTDILAGWRMSRLADAAGLVVSELVTNAVVHTAGPIQLIMRRLPSDRLWLGVRDDSDRMPQRRPVALDDLGGRGLAIIDRLADGWGVTSGDGSGKTVWLELTGRSG